MYSRAVHKECYIALWGQLITLMRFKLRKSSSMSKSKMYLRKVGNPEICRPDVGDKGTLSCTAVVCAYMAYQVTYIELYLLYDHILSARSICTPFWSWPLQYHSVEPGLVLTMSVQWCSVCHKTRCYSYLLSQCLFVEFMLRSHHQLERTLQPLLVTLRLRSASGYYMSMIMMKEPGMRGNPKELYVFCLLRC